MLPRWVAIRLWWVSFISLLSVLLSIRFNFLLTLPRQGVIIKCPLKWQFHDAREVIITGVGRWRLRMAISGSLFFIQNGSSRQNDDYQCFESKMLTIFLKDKNNGKITENYRFFKKWLLQWIFSEKIDIFQENVDY